MAKLAQTTAKYTIIAKFDADGMIEKPDVIGAVFGQTEGLLGPDLELRELQRTGRVGRIKVELNSKNGKTAGAIYIPSSLDSSETALVAACIETIERVGPCNARLYIEKIEDVRTQKRKYVVERAKELLSKIFEEGLPEAQEISEQIKEAVRSSEIAYYKGLPAGPSIDSYDSLIIVEGRADVINLLRCGVKNVIAIEGTSVPKAIAELSKEKILTVFVDGDRGGELILKELQAVCDIDYITRAPSGKEVEELSKKEIFKALRDRIPSEQKDIEEKTEKQERPMGWLKKQETEKKKPLIESDKLEKFKTMLNELIGTRAAYFLDEGLEVLGKVPVKEMFNTMKELEAAALVFDGEVDQKLITFSAQRGVRYILGMRARGRMQVPENMFVSTMEEL